MVKNFLYVVNFGGSRGGLSTVGYTVYNTDGTTKSARSTTGVVEMGTNTGVYAAYIGIEDTGNYIVLWDSGQTPNKYATEEYKSQLNAIQQETDKLNTVWNSLRNQGGIMDALRKKFDLINPKEGLTEVKAAVTGLSEQLGMSKLEEQKEILKKINQRAADLQTALNSVKNIEDKLAQYVNKFEDLFDIMLAVNKGLKDMPGYDKEGKFRNIINMLNSIKGEESEKMKSVFRLYEDLFSKIEQLQTGLDKIDTRKEISDEIRNINAQLKRFLITKEDLSILRAFGHKVK